MEHISIKLEESIARQIGKGMRDFNYSTKTEFIRDAIRCRLKELEEERAKSRAWNALFAARGIFKGKGKAKTEEEWYKWRKEYGEKSAEELVKKFNL